MDFKKFATFSEIDENLVIVVLNQNAGFKYTVLSKLSAHLSDGAQNRIEADINGNPRQQYYEWNLLINGRPKLFILIRKSVIADFMIAVKEIHRKYRHMSAALASVRLEKYNVAELWTMVVFELLKNGLFHWVICYDHTGDPFPILPITCQALRFKKDNDDQGDSSVSSVDDSLLSVASTQEDDDPRKSLLLDLKNEAVSSYEAEATRVREDVRMHRIDTSPFIRGIRLRTKYQSLKDFKQSHICRLLSLGKQTPPVTSLATRDHITYNWVQHKVEFFIDGVFYPVKLPTQSEFGADLHELSKVIKDPVSMLLAQKRLDILHNSFFEHKLKYGSLEDATISAGPVDLVSVAKAETHLHSTAAINERDLLKYFIYFRRNDGKRVELPDLLKNGSNLKAFRRPV